MTLSFGTQGAELERAGTQLADDLAKDFPAGAVTSPEASPLFELVPEALRGSAWMGVELWQWLALLVLALVGFVVDHVVRVAASLFFRRLVNRFHASAPAESVRRLVRPVGLTAAGIVWIGMLRLIGFPAGVLAVLLAAARVFTVLAGTWAGWRLVDLVGDAAQERATRSETTLDDVLVPLLSKTVKAFIVAFGLVYAAQSLNINIVPLITGLGIGGLAFAFAAKDTIENLFGSVAVILDRPFEIGDWIVVEDVEGTVEAVGFRSTRVRTFYNSQVTMPNSQLVSATVDNYGRRRYRRWKTTLGLQYDTTPEQVLAFTEGLRELVRQHPFTRKDYFQVWANEFGPSSLDVLLYVFFEVPDWSTELRERERLFVDVLRLAESLGVQFAFPTRTVHLFQGQAPEAVPAGTAEPLERSTAAAPRPSKTSDTEALRAGVHAAERLVELQPWRREPPGPVDFGTGSDRSNEHEVDPLAATEDSRSRGG